MNIQTRRKLKRYIKFLLFCMSLAKQKWFHDFNFDIMKPLPPTASVKLKSVLTQLQKEIEYIRVSDGTLLGLFRDGRLIPHDNDLDFDVEYTEKNIKTIKEFALEKAWKLGRHVKYHGKTQQLTFYDEEFIIFDFIFWHTDDLFAINFSEPKKFRIMPQKYLKTLKSVNYDEIGTKVNIPEDTETWAEYRYGLTWNVPEDRKGDWTEICGDLGDAWWLTSK